MKPNLILCLRAWADEAFAATAPQSYLLHEAASALEATSGKAFVDPPTAECTRAPAQPAWTLDTCPPFTKPAPRGGGDEGKRTLIPRDELRRMAERFAGEALFTGRSIAFGLLDALDELEAARSLRAKGNPTVTLEEFTDLMKMRDERDSLAAKLVKLDSDMAGARMRNDDLEAKLAEAERERDALAGNLTVEMRVSESARADAARLRGERDESNEEIAKCREIVGATSERLSVDLARLRTLPATVSVTRIEEAAEKIGDRVGYSPEVILAILRSCTATADVEGVANAMHVARWGAPLEENGSMSNAYLKQMARAALAYLGVDAKPAEPRAGFVPDFEKIGAAFLKGMGDWTDGARSAVTEYERQQAEWRKGGAA